MQIYNRAFQPPTGDQSPLARTEPVGATLVPEAGSADAKVLAALAPETQLLP